MNKYLIYFNNTLFLNFTENNTIKNSKYTEKAKILQDRNIFVFFFIASGFFQATTLRK